MKKLIIILYLAGMTACVSNQAAVPYHEGLQREATFQNRLGNVESFTKKSYNEDLKILKAKLNELESKEKKDKNNQSTLSKIEELRAKIKEHENNN